MQYSISYVYVTKIMALPHIYNDKLQKIFMKSHKTKEGHLTSQTALNLYLLSRN